MRNFFSNLSALAIISLFFYSCSPKIDEFKSVPLTEYIPLVQGKYITYRLDSTVFTQQGRSREIRSYQEKHLIDTQLTDAVGRASFRVFRFLKPLSGSGEWKASGTYYITPANGSVEVIEDNLRILKLASPVTTGFSWKANRYLPNNPYKTFYSFSDGFHTYLNDWAYTYEGTGETLTLNGHVFSDVITVAGPNAANNYPPIIDSVFGSKRQVLDRYAKGIGLIYQEYQLMEYQPNPAGTPYHVGFGVKRSLIDHN